MSVRKEPSEVQLVPYDFPLRPDLLIRINLPMGLTVEEAQRVAVFVRTLAFESPTSEGGGS